MAGLRNPEGGTSLTERHSMVAGRGDAPFVGVCLALFWILSCATPRAEPKVSVGSTRDEVIAAAVGQFPAAHSAQKAICLEVDEKPAPDSLVAYLRSRRLSVTNDPHQCIRFVLDVSEPVFIGSKQAKVTAAIMYAGGSEYLFEQTETGWKLSRVLSSWVS